MSCPNCNCHRCQRRNPFLLNSDKEFLRDSLVEYYYAHDWDVDDPKFDSRIKRMSGAKLANEACQYDWLGTFDSDEIDRMNRICGDQPQAEKFWVNLFKRHKKAILILLETCIEIDMDYDDYDDYWEHSAEADSCLRGLFRGPLSSLARDVGKNKHKHFFHNTKAGSHIRNIMNGAFIKVVREIYAEYNVPNRIVKNYIKSVKAMLKDHELEQRGWQDPAHGVDEAQGTFWSALVAVL